MSIQVCACELCKRVYFILLLLLLLLMLRFNRKLYYLCLSYYHSNYCSVHSYRKRGQGVVAPLDFYAKYWWVKGGLMVLFSILFYPSRPPLEIFLPTTLVLYTFLSSSWATTTGRLLGFKMVNIAAHYQIVCRTKISQPYAFDTDALLTKLCRALPNEPRHMLSSFSFT